MNIVTIETALTAYLAGVFELTVDATIFRGSLPSTICDSVGVLLNGAARGNSPAALVFTGQIIGRRASRDNALLLLEKIDAALPVYGALLISGVQQARVTMLKTGNGIVSATTYDGQEVSMITFDLEIAVRPLPNIEVVP